MSTDTVVGRFSKLGEHVEQAGGSLLRPPHMGGGAVSVSSSVKRVEDLLPQTGCKEQMNSGAGLWEVLM